MSLVTSIVDIALAEARRAGAGRINSVRIEVGRLAGVECDAMRFCFEAACRGTAAAGAELDIVEIPGRGRCAACGAEEEVEFAAGVCSACGDGLLEILQGRELRVDSINVD